MIATSKSLLDTVPGNASCAAPATHNAARCGPGEPVVTGIGLAATERIMFVGLTSLSENATFCNARKATEAAASALLEPPRSSAPRRRPPGTRSAYRTAC